MTRFWSSPGSCSYDRLLSTRHSTRPAPFPLPERLHSVAIRLHAVAIFHVFTRPACCNPWNWHVWIAKHRHRLYAGISAELDVEVQLSAADGAASRTCTASSGPDAQGTRRRTQRACRCRPLHAAAGAVEEAQRSQLGLLALPPQLRWPHSRAVALIALSRRAGLLAALQYVATATGTSVIRSTVCSSASVPEKAGNRGSLKRI